MSGTRDAKRVYLRFCFEKVCRYGGIDGYRRGVCLASQSTKN